MRLFVRRLHNNKYDNGKQSQIGIVHCTTSKYGHKYQHYYFCKISSISMPFWHGNVQVFDELDSIFLLKMFQNLSATNLAILKTKA